jgi:hypothetical protein
MRRLTEKKRGVMRSQSSDEQTSEDNDQSTSSQDSQKDNSNQDRDNHGSHDDDEDIDDDFVVQDDGAVIPELPMAFSRHGHQDMRHDFKIVCQLFVHLAMMPMDERREYMENILKGKSFYTSGVINS